MASSRFLALNDQERRTHIAKSAGYAGRDNPDTWANMRGSLGWGVRPFIGCMVRMGDKFVRAQSLTRDPANDQVGEPLRVTLMDLSNYAKIGVCLLDDEQYGPEEPIWPDADAVWAGSGLNAQQAAALEGLRAARATFDISRPESAIETLKAADMVIATFGVAT